MEATREMSRRAEHCPMHLLQTQVWGNRKWSCSHSQQFYFLRFFSHPPPHTTFLLHFSPTKLLLSFFWTIPERSEVAGILVLTNRKFPKCSCDSTTMGVYNDRSGFPEHVHVSWPPAKRITDGHISRNLNQTISPLQGSVQSQSLEKISPYFPTHHFLNGLERWCTLFKINTKWSGF